MYEPPELLAAVDRGTWYILVGFGLAMMLQTVWLVDCIRVARREQVYTMPLFCTFFWFAHDIGCAVRFHDWFVTYDHWYLRFYWVGLLSAVLLEVVFLAQVAVRPHAPPGPGRSLGWPQSADAWACCWRPSRPRSPTGTASGAPWPSPRPTWRPASATSG